MTEGLPAKITAKCVECGDCLLWTGKFNGSGCPTAKQNVRRDVWEATHGPIPAKMTPVPTCGNRACLAHLELATASQIASRSSLRPDVRARKSLAARAPGRIAQRKLTDEAVEQIRRSDGTQSQIAQRFGVAQSLISGILNGHKWRNVTPNPFSGLGAR